MCFLLEHLSNLFLTKKEEEKLRDKVVIRPQWLISIMKEMMKLEMNENLTGINKTVVKDLCATGRAHISLLKICWEKHLTDVQAMNIRHLCLLLKAHCLIFPLKADVEDDNGTCSQTGTFSESGASLMTRGEGSIQKSGYKKSLKNTQNEKPVFPPGLEDIGDDCADDNSSSEPELYLIPCKLPKVTKPNCNVPEENEIYHKFLCKHLMITPTTSSKNSFSQEECVIFTGKENWRIRYKEFEHVIEVSVVG